VKRGDPERVKRGALERVKKGAPERVKRGALERAKRGAPERVKRGAPERVKRGDPERVKRGALERVFDKVFHPNRFRNAPEIWRRVNVQYVLETILIHFRNILNIRLNSTLYLFIINIVPIFVQRSCN
jgi:hypothetical protein